MSDVDERLIRTRCDLSSTYLVGDGLEVGALHNPLWTSERASVRYVDRFDVPALRTHYPELNNQRLVSVDIIDDGEVLSTVENGKVDFIIANHMLEHTENPLGTLRNHLRKLRRGGVLYYAVPDKRYTFDVDRPLTEFEHLVRDDQEGISVSRTDHFTEWARLVNKVAPHDVDARAAELMRINYSIHFHVWDFAQFSSFLQDAARYLGNRFVVEHFAENGNEMIAVLRKVSPARLGISRWIARRLGVDDAIFQKT